jgi:hypothetical protein
VAFSDDSITPAAPSSGDETGDIFKAPDMVWQSPTTTERVVDTQSGFLVVVRRVDSRLALSVKRRLGTPPVSSILLTPDESLKLSYILGDPQAKDPQPTPRLIRSVSPAVDEWLSKIGRTKTADTEDNGDGEGEGVESEEARQAREESLAIQRRIRRQSTRHIWFLLNRRRIIIGASALIVILGIGALVSKLIQKNEPQQKVVVVQAKVDPLDSNKVDKFARNFVSYMLDFNPSSYKYSQVQAMSYMTPELLDKYWHETNFPLERAQLKLLPQGQTVMITRVLQTKINNAKKDVDIYAELASSPNNKILAPVHLKLTITPDEDGRFRVIAQKDLSNGK